MKAKRYSISQGICIDAHPDKFVIESDYLALVRASRRILDRFYDSEKPDAKQFDELIVLRNIVQQEQL
jgi:ferredoxin